MLLLRPGLPALLLAAFALSPHARGAEKWKVQYFHDADKSVLNIVDMQFPSASRGVAVGMIREGDREKPVAVVTTDSGANWQNVELRETPVSLFFLSESLGWMVTEKGLWQTTEAGKNWRKLPRVPAQIFRVYFLTEKDGWAAGLKKKVLETHDGGLHWTPVPAAAEPPGSADQSVYNVIAFASPKMGLITGWNIPQRREVPRLPDWLDPEAAGSRRSLPHLSYTLATNDGGRSWKASSASLFGEIARLRFLPNGAGLGLLQYENGFRYPSEVFKIDWQVAKNETVYRDRRFHITDIWLTPDGTAYLAGSVVAGQVRSIIPGKVQVLKSRDLSSWTEIEVDYRAQANRVTLAGFGSDHLWLATDGGMILKLTR